jgi:hypothetical protein
MQSPQIGFNVCSELATDWMTGLILPEVTKSELAVEPSCLQSSECHSRENHSHLYNNEVKNPWSCIYFPIQIFSMWCLTLSRRN